MLDRHALGGLVLCLVFVVFLDGSIEALNKLAGLPRKEAVVWVCLSAMCLIGLFAIAGVTDYKGRRCPMSFTGRLWLVFWGNLLTFGLFVLACSEVVTRLGVRLVSTMALANCLGMMFLWRTPPPAEKTETPYDLFGFGLLIVVIGAEVAGSITMTICYRFGISDLVVFGSIFAPMMFGAAMLLLWFSQKQYQWR
jgi:hypothetical protein